ncbi:MAG: putative sodium/proton antiporter [Pedosphaera sp.]|nr:putative sodium/proton antiporter [Pedosphaera sp.]
MDSHAVTFLQDLAVVMLVAGLVTVIFHRLKQPVVLGYIVAGVIIGPHTPPFPLIRDEETIRTLAELGVIFLMFSLGLEFSLRKLKEVGATAFIAAFLEITLMVWAGYELGRLFGWNTMDSLFLGAMLSISSTTIIIKALGELGKTKERFGELIFGILIVEDIMAIVMIALLSGIAMSGSLRANDVALTVGRLGVFLVVVLVAGLLAVPRLLAYVGRFKSNEVLLVTVLGLCFGVCLLAVKLGYSVALGAFIIGAVVAEAREIRRVERLMEPLRDMFSAVFFVAIGLLIDPRLLLEYAWPILVITVVVVVGKVLTCSFGTFVAGNDLRTSLRVGMGLAQIGEFSFIIATLGLTLGVTSKFLYPIAVTVSAITTLLTPYLIKSADAVVAGFDRKAPPALVGYLEVYTRWVGQLRTRRQHTMAGRLIRKWTWQMALNLTLVAGVFITAAYFEQRPPAWLAGLPGGEKGLKAFYWLTAMVASLPFLIATFRKLQALGLLVSELSVSRAAAGEKTAMIRGVVAQMVPLAGFVGLGLFVLALSSTLLPPIEVLILLLLVVALITWVWWRSFVKIYAKGQVALKETFSQPLPPRHEPPTPLLQGILAKAELKTLGIAAGSAAAGKLIGELALRSRSGASIVGLERKGDTLVNPGPDEEILAGDQLLLLGSQPQLEAAEKILNA